MATASISWQLASDDVQRQARRGLAVYFAIVVPLTAVFQVIIISTGDFVPWVIPLMRSPAAASVAARLILREDFSDVSFRLGGHRGGKAILVGLIIPIVIGLIAYGIAWMSGMAQFEPNPEGLVAQLVGESASSVRVFLVMLALTATIGTIFGTLTAAGEEIGWRGYMLTRLIDAGVPRPILVSGLIWGLWHIPLVLAGVYVAGLSPIVSAMLFMVSVTSMGVVIARMRLETGSIWPAIALHGAWNSIIQGAFDPATTGAGATLWVGEAGIFTALALAVAAVIFSRGQWTVRRVPKVRQVVEFASSPSPHT